MDISSGAHRIRRNRPFGKAKGAALFALAIVWLGCNSPARAPLYEYSSDGERLMRKRLAKRLSGNMESKMALDRIAYVEGSTVALDSPSPEQQETLELFGRPEHVRKPFWSTEGDKVDEWLYPRHNLLVQWIQGRKAYEGEITDMERILLRKGYPLQCFSDVDHFGVSRQSWIYRDEIEAKQEIVYFADGRQVFSNTID